MADVFYTRLCQRKAENFAIFGKAETMPIWVCYKGDKVVDVLKVPSHLSSHLTLHVLLE